MELVSSADSPAHNPHTGLPRFGGSSGARGDLGLESSVSTDSLAFHCSEEGGHWMIPLFS